MHTCKRSKRASSPPRGRAYTLRRLPLLLSLLHFVSSVDRRNFSMNMLLDEHFAMKLLLKLASSSACEQQHEHFSRLSRRSKSGLNPAGVEADERPTSLEKGDDGGGCPVTVQDEPCQCQNHLKHAHVPKLNGIGIWGVHCSWFRNWGQSWTNSIVERSKWTFSN